MFFYEVNDEIFVGIVQSETVIITPLCKITA